jgi:hypothetical protein
MGVNVMDFTDLGKGIEFTFQNQKYEIPSFTKTQMTNLMEISEKMVAVSKSLSPEDKEALKNNEIKTEELKNLFNIQQEFIIAGIRKNVEDKLVELTMPEVEGWPWRLCNRVISLIQEMMNTTGDVEKDAKKNPTQQK